MSINLPEGIRRPKVRTLVGWIMGTGVVAVALAISSALPERPAPSETSALHASARAEQDAIEAVQGRARVGGMRFGTWLDTRVHRLCRPTRNRTPAWTASSVQDGEGSTYFVSYSYGEIEGCSIDVTHHPALALLLPSGRIQAMFTDSPTWLDEFDAGKAP